MLHLLATTDFSEPAEYALDRAVSLASLRPDASLTVMHVHTAAGFEVVRKMLGAKADEMERALVADAESRLRALAAKFETVLGRTVRVRLSRGNPVAEIAAATAELSADLVIMGAQSRTPDHSPFWGGTIERVVRNIPGSLLAVKRPAASPYTRILVAIGSWQYSQAAVKLAALFNPGAEIILLHAFEAPFEKSFRRVGAAHDWVESYRLETRRAAEGELEQLAARLDADGIQARRVVVHGSPAPAIVDHARTLAADLIVVGRNNQSMMGDVLFGNVARRVAVDSAADVFVANPIPLQRVPADPGPNA